MQPIQDLFNRIRHDEDFARASFRIGYYDRLADRIVQVSFRRLHFPPSERFVFELTDREGVVHRIPFHRVREVYRNGELIWSREGS